MKVWFAIAGISWAGLWLTPDQLGQRQLQRGDFADAAKSFGDPMWRGVAFYRAGEFEKAARTFALLESPEAEFNQGNSWLMNGKYETAIACYDRALGRRPYWREASENRDLAIARSKMTESKGGDMGDQKIGADKIVFDKNKENKGQDTELTGETTSSSDQMQALWLRRVQTRPADFLKSKFAYQHAEGGEP